MSIDVNVQNDLVIVTESSEDITVNVSNAAGPAGVGVPVGGTTGQVLKKLSNTNYDTYWALDGGGVPYSGATGDVNLGEFGLRAGQLTLDTSPTGTAAVGTTRWNDTIGSSETTLKGGSVVLKNGIDLVARVVNKVNPNTTLTKAAYQAVRVSGAQGQRLAVAFAQANNDANSADTIGLVTETIATNQEGFIICVGQIENINTTGSLQGETWADGDVLYLSPFTPGAITKVKPTGAGHIVVIGYVEYAHQNNGKIYVKVMNGWELDELHDVSIVSPANNDALIYESSTSLWKNKTIATALGYTPVPATRTLTINGTAFDLSADRSWTIAAGITGSGVANQLTYWNGTGSVTGSANLVWDNTNARLGIGTSSPATRLDIVSASGAVASGVAIRNNGSGSSDYASLNLYNNTANIGQLFFTGSGYFISGLIGPNGLGFYNNGAGGITLWADSGAIKFQTGTGGGTLNSQRMTLTAAGRLLLGTTTESVYILDAVGLARFSADILVANNFSVGVGVGSGTAFNTILGIQAHQLTTSGGWSTAIGYQALRGNINGNFNTAVGSSALTSGGGGSHNTSLGFYALGASTSGSNNLALGSQSGSKISGGVTDLTTSNNSIFIGYNAFALGNSQTNQIVIGTSATGLGSNTTVIGNSSTTDTAIYGRMLVNYSSPVIGTFALDVNGTARVSTNLTIGGSNNTRNTLLYFDGGTTSSRIGQGYNNGMVFFSSFSLPFKFGFDQDATNFTTASYTLGIGGFNSTLPMSFSIGGSGIGNRVLTFDGGSTSQRSGIGSGSVSQGGLALYTFSGFDMFFGSGFDGSNINSSNAIMWISASNSSLNIGSTSNLASSILTLASTTKGFRPPVMTTSQKTSIASPAAGLQVYDTTLNQMSYYNGTTWVNF